jgi:uncharacterized Zn finger protein (UPF0148 family)
MAEFGALNLEDMAGEDARLKDKGGAGGFLDQFVPMPEVKPGQTGSVTVRLLPPVKGGKLFQYNRVHTLNDRKIHCPRPLINGKWDRNVACPICDYYSSLWRQIDKLEKAGRGAEAEKIKEEARAIKPVERYYYNAIVRSMTVDSKEMKNVGPRILSIGKKLHELIIEAIVGRKDEPDSKLGNITDLKNGWDFVIRKEVTLGDGFPNYAKSGFARNPTPAGTAEEIKKWQESLHDLTKLRNPKELDYLEKELAIHRGLIPDEAEGFDTEGFDARWKQQAAADSDEDDTPKRATVTVPAGVPAAKPAAPAPAPAVVPETTSIEDAAFLKELEEMEGKS